MLVVHTTLSKAEIRKGAKEAKRLVSNWFLKNPKRRVCKFEVWYSDLVKVRRGHVDEDVDAAALKAINK